MVFLVTTTGSTAERDVKKSDQIKMKLYLAFVMSLIFPFVAAASERVQIRNFSQLYEAAQLSEGDQTRRYHIKSNGIDIQLSNRIIIKVKSSIKKTEIANLDKDVKNITELYQAKDFTYLMADLKSASRLEQVIPRFEQHPGVLLAQPDILQLNRLSNRERSDTQRRTSSLREASLETPLLVKNSELKRHPLDLPRQTKAKDIRVAIIDDGFDLSHPEFSSTNVAFQYDTETQTPDASPKQPQDNHGTRIAGILFAARNGNQVEGLIPEATLIAIRQPNTWTSQTLLAFQLARLAGADVINCSWHSGWLLEPVRDVVSDLATAGRNGKGIAVVFAAGNDGKALTPNQHEASIKEAIVIGSMTKKGHKARYSNWGDTVDGYLDGSRHLSTANQGNFSLINGTSLAAARASGLIATIMADHPEMSLINIEHQIKHLKSDHHSD